MIELSDPITLRLPVDVLADIERVADACERTRSWVMVRAMKFYLASQGEGGQVMAIVRGREQLDRGEGQDFDDVMAEIEAMIGDDNGVEAKSVSDLTDVEVLWIMRSQIDPNVALDISELPGLIDDMRGILSLDAGMGVDFDEVIKKARAIVASKRASKHDSKS